MRGNRSFILAGAGLAVAVLLGATVWLRPAEAAPTMTVYKSPT